MMLAPHRPRNSRLRRRRPRRPRPLHLGRNPARKLPQHHHHHRSARPVHRASTPKPPATSPSAAAKVKPRDPDRAPGHRAQDHAPPARRRLAASSASSAASPTRQLVLDFVNSAHAEQLAYLGTSCPDHFIRTKIRPMFVKWDPCRRRRRTRRAHRHGARNLSRRIRRSTTKPTPCPTRPPSATPAPPSSSFPASACSASAKTKLKSRIIGEFYTNAIHVMEGASASCRRRSNRCASPVPARHDPASASKSSPTM